MIQISSSHCYVRYFSKEVAEKQDIYLMIFKVRWKRIIKIQWQIQQDFIECHSSQGTVRYIISFAVSGQMAKFQVIIAFDSHINILNL